MDRQHAIDRLMKSGIRPTPQRVLVYDYLLNHPVHPTADTIYYAVQNELPTLSRTTIYNTLTTLCEAGLVRTLCVGIGEMRYDGFADEHGHFKCLSCGEVFDFSLQDSLAFAKELKDFTITASDVNLKGLCPRCRKMNQSNQNIN